LRGHVDGIARAIDITHSQPYAPEFANVNPVFTWVRLARRIPVCIHIDEMPPGVVLSTGMIATVEIDILECARGT
jgi:multidrug resistance efflux pump